MSNASLTAAQWNASVRDNLNETAVAKATTAGGHFAATGANSIAQRIPVNQSATASVSTTSTAFVTLTGGPAVTATTGPMALITLYCRQSNSTTGQNSWTSVQHSGATSTTGDVNRAISYDQPGEIYHGISYVEDALSAGSNTFAQIYKVNGGTGTFSARRISVVPF